MSAKLNLEVAGKKKKKNHSFLVHHAQFGGANTSLPINVLRRNIITYYSINFLLHKNCMISTTLKKLGDIAVAFKRFLIREKRSSSKARWN